MRPPTPESVLVHDILATFGARPGIRLFRNNSGMFPKAGGGMVRTGLCPGASDLIGWKNGRFVALECKSARGRATVEQQAFITAVIAAGGIGAVVRSVEEARVALGE